ncbi:MAG: hypothetical protein PHN88_05635 [Ignavibacteria bacterium]|nr:hypothetical protein [Ignavibacteria bacterium]
MKKIHFISFTALLLILISVSCIFAQNDTTNKRLKKIVKEKLIEKLNIDDQTAEKLITLQMTHRKEIKELKRHQGDLIKDISDNPQSSDISSKIDDLLDTEYNIYLKNKDYIGTVKTFLTPAQIAQSMAFEKDLMKFLKKEIKRKHHDDKDDKDRDNGHDKDRDKDNGKDRDKDKEHDFDF